MLGENQLMAREVATDLMKGWAVARETGYSWVRTYSAGSDAFVYRRFKGEITDGAEFHRADFVPLRVVAFCDANSSDVAVDCGTSEVRKPRQYGSDAP